jgi:MYXO-CTERM domain-containing protein
MYRGYLFAGMLLLTASSFAQEPGTVRNPNAETYPQDSYNRPVEIRHGSGNWGLLGLLGLTGLFGLGRRRSTVIRDQDEYVTTGQQRKAS